VLVRVLVRVLVLLYLPVALPVVLELGDCSLLGGSMKGSIPCLCPTLWSGDAMRGGVPSQC
jgi:hypothetical protein